MLLLNDELSVRVVEQMKKALTTSDVIHVITLSHQRDARLYYPVHFQVDLVAFWTLA